MSVERVRGDLLKWDNGINVILHSVNGQGVMKSGLAKAIKDLYPAAHDAYQAAYKTGARLGSISYADVGDGGKVINAVMQWDYRRDSTDKTRFTDYEAVYTALSTVRDLLENAHLEGRHYTLGLPFNLGCDRGGASWNVVFSMIVDVFASSPVRCVIVQLPDPAPAAAVAAAYAPADKPEPTLNTTA